LVPNPSFTKKKLINNCIVYNVPKRAQDSA